MAMHIPLRRSSSKDKRLRSLIARGRIWLAAGAIVSLLACTSSEELSQLHREIGDVQRQVEQLRAKTVAKGDLAGIEQRLQEGSAKIQGSNSELTAWVAELQQQIEVLSASLDLTTRQLEIISQELAAARAELESYSTKLPSQPTEPNANSADSGGSASDI
jgi:chromosome segregation ATPase